MNEDELRSLIRAAIQTHMHSRSAEAPLEVLEPGRTTPDSISFSQYPLARANDDTMCIIEPAVRCNHCGFCKCHGH